MELALYQTAHLLLLQGNIEAAEAAVNQISGDSHLAEQAMIMQAEILDYIHSDFTAAVDIYLEFLEQYPQSIYYDDVRMRLRELAG